MMQILTLAIQVFSQSKFDLNLIFVDYIKLHFS